MYHLHSLEKQFPTVEVFMEIDINDELSKDFCHLCEIFYFFSDDSEFPDRGKLGQIKPPNLAVFTKTGGNISNAST